MIARIFVRARRIRRWFNRSERAVNWLGLSRDQGQGGEPGLVLIQVDGLGHAEFQRALSRGRLPFIKRLLEQEGYCLKSLYSGVPSTTPAVQAELFFGKKTALPAFSYLDPEDGQLVKLFDPPAAKRMEQELNAQSDGLTSGGAAYGNIFGGGADESETHFCVSALGWDELRRGLNPFTFAALALMNLMSVVRILVLLIAEFGLAIVDFAKGVRSGQDPRSEAKFILARVGVCIGLRELIVIGASMDIARGLPIIHLNLAAFDEQSHRRGPSSAFAHWVLKGIDHAIKRLWVEAKRSPARDYRVWIYSDHGQEQVIPYPVLAGKKIQAVVAALMREHILQDSDEGEVVAAAMTTKATQEESYRTRTLSQKRWREQPPQPEDIQRPGTTRVVAMGPIGFIYAPRRLSFEEKATLAAELTLHHQVPCVFGFDDNGELYAWISGAQLRLPEQQAVLIGQAHPFAAQVMEDLLALCKHPGSGDLIISGWRDGMKPVSFALENGSHGGFAPHETHGVALLDSKRELPQSEYAHVRPSDLRLAALQLLNRTAGAQSTGLTQAQPQAVGGRLKLRVMTYNVHSCIGMDGRCSPQRIARMISKFDPDIVALQELDNGRAASGHVHQVREIAQMLNMHFIYFPVVCAGPDEYGEAFISRWPLDLVISEQLPRYQQREARGVLWATLTVTPLVQVQLLVTHLGLSAQERKRQVNALMSDSLVGAALQRGPTILLGDFNATEKGYSWRRITRQLADVQQMLQGWKPRKTWFSTHPSLRLDHIFVSNEIRVDALHRPIGTDFQMASDHLPLVADLVLAVSSSVTLQQPEQVQPSQEQRESEVRSA